jgi:hypothetical protein
MAIKIAAPFVLLAFVSRDWSRTPTRAQWAVGLTQRHAVTLALLFPGHPSASRLGEGSNPDLTMVQDGYDGHNTVL